MPKKLRKSNPTAFIAIGVCFVGAGIAMGAAQQDSGGGIYGAIQVQKRWREVGMQLNTVEFLMNHVLLFTSPACLIRTWHLQECNLELVL